MLTMGCVVIVYGDDGVKHFRDEWRQQMWRHWFFGNRKTWECWESWQTVGSTGGRRG